MLLLLLACAPHPTALDSAVLPVMPPSYVLRGGTVVGVGLADVQIEDGRIVAVGEIEGGETIDVSGQWIVPGFIDSHVHLAYLPEGEALAAGGIVGAVDLAAPEGFLAEDHGPLRIVAAGPMITAESGYPTESWGRDGYGLECADAAAAVAAVEHLYALGARVVKLPVTGSPVLGPDALTAATEAAHAHGMKVASHALGDDQALLAANAGIDALAHTPVEALSEETLAAWEGRAVISTISAFGGESVLAALREHGAIVLYGTDFGNTRTTGISSTEIVGLMAAGLDGAAILASGTSAPAAFWGFDDLGAIAPGMAASLLVLDADPLRNPLTLATPAQVYVDGRLYSSASQR